MATTTVQAASPARSGPTHVATTSARQLPWWARELGLLVGVYVIYSLGRLVVGADVGAAMERGAQLVTLEGKLSWLSEVRLNEALQSVPVLAVAAAYWYSLLHYTVTPVVLVWLRRRHPGSYGSARTALVVATLLGLVGFWLYPTAPPRMLTDHGFVDTLASFSNWGWWSTDASAPKGLGGLTNELAAMPSLHVGWAVWVGWYVATHSSRRLVRIAAVGYPVITTLVVVATANHYWLDAVAGAALVGAVIALARIGSSRVSGDRHPANMRSRISGTLVKMTAPQMDNTVAIHTGTIQGPASSPTAAASCPHPAATNPA